MAPLTRPLVVGAGLSVGVGRPPRVGATMENPSGWPSGWASNQVSGSRSPSCTMLRLICRYERDNEMSQGYTTSFAMLGVKPRWGIRLRRQKSIISTHFRNAGWGAPPTGKPWYMTRNPFIRTPSCMGGPVRDFCYVGCYVRRCFVAIVDILQAQLWCQETPCALNTASSSTCSLRGDPFAADLIPPKSEVSEF